MNTLELKSIRELVLRSNEKVYQGENKIISFDVVLPEKIGDYATAECNIEMRCYLGDNYIPFEISTASRKTSTKVTSDITEVARTVQIIFYITHGDDVIGKTNKVDLIVCETKAGTPIDPRSELDEIIRQQRATIAEQAETISEQATAIEAKDGQISELNGQVTELEAENAEQAQTITRQNTTIDELNRRVPPLETLDPITPTVEQVTYRPSGDNVGFTAFTVNPIPHDQIYGNSVGGIYLFDDEQGNITTCVIKDWDSAVSFSFAQMTLLTSSTFPLLETISFINCERISSIAIRAFQNFASLKNITFPSNITSIALEAFLYCSALIEVDIPSSVLYLGNGAFGYTTSLQKVVLHNGIQTIDYTFYSSGVKTINFPNSLTSISNIAFNQCSKLEFVTIENGFNCNNLNLSYSTLYSHDTILSWFNALADRTGETAYTLTIGKTNLNKMTAEEKAIATNKNWNLA